MVRDQNQDMVVDKPDRRQQHIEGFTFSVGWAIVLFVAAVFIVLFIVIFSVGGIEVMIKKIKEKMGKKK
jgi:hypothetical protein